MGVQWRGFENFFQKSGEERIREGCEGEEGRGGALDESSLRIRYMLTKSVSLAHMRSTTKLIPAALVTH